MWWRKRSYIICENIGATWKDLKYGKWKDHYYARHVVPTAVVSTQSNSNILATKNCVGLNYISIQQARECRQLLESEVEGMKWVKTNRKQQSEALNDNVKQTMIGWWTKETRVSPNVKDVVWHLTASKYLGKVCCSFVVGELGKFLASTSFFFCILFCMFEVLFFDFL